MAQTDIPFQVQIELLELVAENEDFQKSAKQLEVLGPEEIRRILRGIAAVLRAGMESGVYDSDKSEVLSDKVKNTLDHLNPTEKQMLYSAFGLGGDED